MLGPDVVRLTERILHPEAYYERKSSRHVQLEVWIVGICPGFQKHVERVKRRKRLYDRWSSPREERATNLLEGTEILNKRVIRQLEQRVEGPIAPNNNGVIDSNSYTIPGDNWHVKMFNLFGSYPSTGDAPFRIGVEILGMRFTLSWDIRNHTSNKRPWEARDGIPYIDPSNPFENKLASQDRSRTRDLQKAGYLVFHSEYPNWDPQATVSLPIGHILVDNP